MNVDGEEGDGNEWLNCTPVSSHIVSHAAPTARRAPKHFDETVTERAAPPAAGRASMQRF